MKTQKKKHKIDTAAKKFREIQMRLYDWAGVLLFPAGDGDKRKRKRTSEEVVIELLI